MNGSYITIPSTDGGRFSAYKSVPVGGSGPGLILLQEIFGINPYMKQMADHFAEEGYVVVVPDLFWRLEPDVVLGYTEEDFSKAMALYGKLDVDKCIQDVGSTMEDLRQQPEQIGKVAVLGYCLGGKLAYLTAARTDVDCAVGYYPVGVSSDLAEAIQITCPMVMHFAEEDGFVPAATREEIFSALADKDNFELYAYPGVDHAFATEGRPSYHKPSTLMAYSRSIAALRRVMGPYHDYSQLWDMHCYHEFATRDVGATMATMVSQPYVNHIPTMTGGVGQDHLKRFYKYHFVDSNPQDTRLIPVSRTIGADRVVDELLFCFTHDCVVPWMLPGVEPTGKYVEIPLVAIVNFRGDKLYNEHIYWDQASVLVQIGKLNPHGLPVAGIETAKKLIDETLPSNELMAEEWSSSEGKPL